MTHKPFKNRIVLIISLSICLFSCCERYSVRNDDNKDSQNYYWSADKKVYVTRQEGAYIIKLDEGVTRGDISNRLSTNVYAYGVDNLAILNNVRLKLTDLKSTQGINNAMYRYKIGDNPIDLTGEILLQPKQGIEIDELLILIDNRATVKEETEYGTYILYTDDWDKLFDYSNRLYESKLVEYSHPNLRTPLLLP